MRGSSSGKEHRSHCPAPFPSSPPGLVAGAAPPSPEPSRRWTWVLTAALVLGGCGDSSGLVATGGGDFPVDLELVADGFDAPVFVTAAPGDTDRLFVVEQGGVIRVVRDGTVLEEPFLDITNLVSTGEERGLLGLAFHPDYLFNGWFFINYTDTVGDTRVVRYTVSGDPDVADPDSWLDILVVEQPYPNHNGGMLAFDARSLLYIGLGDGGGSDDPDDNAQDPGTLLGSMLRVNVNGSTVSQPYVIPVSNPFVGDPEVRPETWAYGLRNPWRYSFDRATGDLYIADVGQSAWEEVSVQPGGSPGGQNYGWPILEGTRCYPAGTACNDDGLTLPVHTYAHGDGCSVTGGYVYRGEAIPQLSGRYLFGDFCGGWVRSFLLSGGEATDVREHPDLAPGGNVVSFGQDALGELYVVEHGGAVYRIVPR